MTDGTTGSGASYSTTIVNGNIARESTVVAKNSGGPTAVPAGLIPD